MGQQVPSIGRIVQFNIGADIPRWRPAIIVHVWGDECVNLQVFLDDHNDYGITKTTGMLWQTSVMLGEGRGQWRWPPRV